MEISIEKLDELVAEGDGIFMSREAEEVLVQFLEIKKQVEHAEQQIKHKLITKGLSLSTNFKSIEGEKISIRYQKSGVKYELHPETIETVPRNLYNVKFTPETKEIDAYYREHRALPAGITPKDRRKTLYLSLRNNR